MKPFSGKMDNIKGSFLMKISLLNGGNMKNTEIKNFDEIKPFSSFLPGIAGLKGIPMWCFYVNRGQGIASFGVENKNNAIMEFFPANTMYQNVARNGFRTFVKIDGNIYEPFKEGKANQSIDRNMNVGMNSLEIIENNDDNNLETKVEYFTVPQDKYAALSRTLIIKNCSDKDMNLEILDGMPSIIPFGINNDDYKSVGNTLRAWMGVSNLEEKVPFYKVRSSTADTSEVSEVNKGHFYLSFNEENELINPIYDMDVIFGSNTSLSYPEVFSSKTIEELKELKQYYINKVSGAFAGVKITVKPGEEFKLYSLIGHISSVEELNSIKDRITNRDYIEEKRSTASELTEDLTNQMHSSTNLDLFDQYARQCYLDNVLRGGFPILLGNEKNHVYHVFSRKHGDLERDYNFYSLSPEMYSQGNGNFRDANQNRRNDIFFNPKVGTFNVKLFMNLIQLDGYNPLVVKGSLFKINNLKEVKKVLKEIPVFLEESFTPGQLITYLLEKFEENKADELMHEVLDFAEQSYEADFGEGFWVDHWTYNMDHIESYLNVFPDKKLEMLFDEKDYVYFNSPAKVKTRDEKYISTESGMRQYDAIDESHDSVSLIRENYGKGDIYKTNLFAKLFNLAVIKFSTLDFEGIGIEMEANKPGWNDSLNGLPGLFGSGVSETLELKRLISFLLSIDHKNEIELPIEVFNHTLAVIDRLERYISNESNDSSFQYWSQVTSLKENYRAQIYKGISGEVASFDYIEIITILEAFLSKINEGLNKATDLGDGLIPTYMRYDILTSETNKSEILGHRVKRLPYFLEGPTKALKVMENEDEKKDLYKRVKESNIYDKTLRMYKVCENLDSESYEIGRARAFTPGWLENESIFLHMSYKYLLEVLRAGLYDEFYEDIQTSLVPMMNPEVYGRSILENSSFIASSANPDTTQHGRGYIARLSGSTAEFIHIWILMMAGEKPFRYVNKQLELHFEPLLHSDFFNKDNQVSFNLFGSTEVVYVNSTKKNTWMGLRTSRIELYSDKEKREFTGFIPSPYSEQVRDGKFKKIIVTLEEKK